MWHNIACLFGWLLIQHYSVSHTLASVTLSFFISWFWWQYFAFLFRNHWSLYARKKSWAKATIFNKRNKRNKILCVLMAYICNLWFSCANACQMGVVDFFLSSLIKIIHILTAPLCVPLKFINKIARKYLLDWMHNQSGYPGGNIEWTYYVKLHVLPYYFVHFFLWVFYISEWKIMLIGMYVEHLFVNLNSRIRYRLFTVAIYRHIGHNRICKCIPIVR